MTDAAQLGILLRSWRARTQPTAVGFPAGADPRRTPGLRREEVGWLSGVSPDYVKRLEQGRAHPSGSVLRALSRALQLSDTEYDLACRLAGHSAVQAGHVPQRIGPGVRRLLDRLGDVPVSVYDTTWTLLDCNEPWAALHGDVYSTRSVNLVWQHFRGAASGVQVSDMDGFERSLVADLQDATVRYPADEQLIGMIRALRSLAPGFARLWEAPCVAHHGDEQKQIDHPVVGEITVSCDVLSVHGADLRLLVYTVEPDSPSALKLDLLTSLHAHKAAVQQQTDAASHT